MTQPETMDPGALQDLEVVDNRGGKIGTVDVVFVDHATGQPSWAAVKIGLFGGRGTLVPLVNARAGSGRLIVPYAKDAIKNAPEHDPAVELSSSDEAELRRYYGLPEPAVVSPTVDPPPAPAGEPVAADEQNADDPKAITRDEAGGDSIGEDSANGLIRSEERLKVDTETATTGTARLRKFVVTEQVTVTVPVSHEEVRLVHEPITGADRDALPGAEITEQEHDHGIVLHAERPVVTTETVPVERVHLETVTVQSEQQITADVSKEQIEQVLDERET